MLREIVLDTETTGLHLKDGHRLIEIGCIELIDKAKTGKHFHAYINPRRLVAEAAYAIHGISDEFLRDKPIFAKVAKDFVDFIGNSRLVIHNAPFDIRFLNHELALVGLPILQSHRVVDTLLIARKKFPGSPVSLDALCKRFAINLDTREKHGALIDAELLAMVYLMMYKAVQTKIVLEDNKSETFYAIRANHYINEYKKNISNISAKDLVDINNEILEQYSESKVEIISEFREKILSSISDEDKKLHMKLMSKIKNNGWYD